MSCTIADLTLKLQKALDNNYDVVDMATVQFVISQLEGATITKEQLETTRLAKYINGLRRRTWSEHLARRSKSLLKKWREMLIPTITPQQQPPPPPPPHQQQPAGGQLLTAAIIPLQSHSQPTSPTTLPTATTMPSRPLSKHHQQNINKTDNFLNSSTNSMPDYAILSNEKSNIGGNANKRRNSNIVMNGGGYNSRPYEASSSSYTTPPKTPRGSLYLQQQQQHHLIDIAASTATTNKRPLNQDQSSTLMHSQQSNKSKRLRTSFSNLIGSQSQPAPSISDLLNSGQKINYHDDSRSPLTITTLPRYRQSPNRIIDDLELPYSPLDFDHSSNASRDDYVSTGSKMVISNKLLASNKIVPITSTNKNNTNRPLLLNGDHYNSTPFNIEDSNSNSNLLHNPNAAATLSQSILSPVILSEQILSKKSNQQHLDTIKTVQETHNVLSADHRKSKKHKKDKKRNKQQHQSTEKQITNDMCLSNSLRSQFNNVIGDETGIIVGGSGEPTTVTSDETQLCSGQTTGFQTHDSLSNSSMSLFPSTSTNTTMITHNNTRFTPNNNSIALNSDLTFAGKFKNVTKSSYGILANENLDDVMLSGLNQNAITMKPMLNDIETGLLNSSITQSAPSTPKPVRRRGRNKKNINEVVILESGSSSPIFTPLAGNSNDSCASSLLLQNDSHSRNNVINVNQDSVSGIININNIQNQQQPLQQLNIISTLSQQGHIDKINKKNKANMMLSSSMQQMRDQPKQTKKRGRKKGSKGIDAMLAQSNAFLNSQFFDNTRFLKMSSFKKVKTTKELLADIQNRKLGSATSSPTLMPTQSQPLPSPSSGSDVSLQSVCNSDVRSTSDTPISISTQAHSTPDRQSISILPHARTQGDPEEYNTGSDSDDTMTGIKLTINNYDGDGGTSCHTYRQRNQNKTADGYDDQKILNQLISRKSIEDDIQELKSLLPEIDRSQLMLHDDTDVICTCSTREIEQISIDLPKNEDDIHDLDGLNDDINLNKDINKFDERSLKIDNKIQYENKEEPFRILKSASSSLPPPPLRPSMHEKILPINQLPQSINKVPIKPVKSIFDLDYDEDDDPIHSYVEAAKLEPKLFDTASHSNNDENIIVNIEKKDIFSDTNNLILNSVIKMEKVSAASLPSTGIADTSSTSFQLNQPEINMELLNIPKYEVIEDPNCEAKKRYEIQTNCITKFHINNLHNSFIPSINGNWAYSSDKSVDVKEENVVDSNDLSKNDELFERVVPQYNHIITDKIPKDLSHVHFAPTSKYNLGKSLRKRLAKAHKYKRRKDYSNNNKGYATGDDENDCKQNNINEFNGDENDHININNNNNQQKNCTDSCSNNNVETTRIINSNDNIDDNDLNNKNNVCCVRISNEHNLIESANNVESTIFNINNNVSINNIKVENDENETKFFSYSCTNNKANEEQANCYDNDNDNDSYYDCADDYEVIDNKSDLDRLQDISNHDLVSSTSTSNQSHIVLTIKKTPTKKNSLLSPLLANNNTIKSSTLSSDIDNNSSISNNFNNDIKFNKINNQLIHESNINSMAVSSDDVISHSDSDNNLIKIHKMHNINYNNNSDSDNNFININDNENCNSIKLIKKINSSSSGESSASLLGESSSSLSTKKYVNFDMKKDLSSVVFDSKLKMEAKEEVISTDDEDDIKDEEVDEDEDENDEDDENDDKNGDDINNDDIKSLPEDNNGLLKSFNNLDTENRTGLRIITENNEILEQQFREWHEVLQIRSYNDELLTILPYVVID